MWFHTEHKSKIDIATYCRRQIKLYLRVENLRVKQYQSNTYERESCSFALATKSNTVAFLLSFRLFITLQS